MHGILPAAFGRGIIISLDYTLNGPMSMIP